MVDPSRLQEALREIAARDAARAPRDPVEFEAKLAAVRARREAYERDLAFLKLMDERRQRRQFHASDREGDPDVL